VGAGPDVATIHLSRIVNLAGGGVLRPIAPSELAAAGLSGADYLPRQWAKAQYEGKTYGDNPVIQGVDLDIEDGRFVVFVGPSGCGKSTLLRMIAGLEDITDGTLEVGGVVSNTVEPARRGIAMVFQSYAQ
jgi:ABC-type multidrug transport system fused ATPase/permease subunit